MSVAGRLRIARRIPEGAQQVRLERVGAVCDAAGTAELRQLRHLEPLKPAGVDAGEGLEIERHVECQAVIARATAHAHPDARELAARHVHARRVAPSFGEDAELSRELYHGALERRDVIADAEAHAREINQRVDDELSRSVIGHLAATVDLHHRNLARGDEVRAARIEPEGEDRRVLEKTDLVRGRRIAPPRAALPRAASRLVLATPR